MGIHHANMVRDAVAGIHEILQQEPVPVEASGVIQYPQVAHVENCVQYNQHYIADQLQHIQAMVQAVQLHYVVSQPTYQAYGVQGHNGGNNGFRGRRGRGYLCQGNW